MKVPHLLIALLFGLLFASSCTFYKPTTTMTPVMKGKGDLAIGGSIISSIDGMAAYSPVNHLVVKGQAGTSYNISYSSEDSQGNVREMEANNYNVEAAAGFYNMLGEHIRYQVLGGYAFGESGTLYDGSDFSAFTDGMYKANYSNVFAQPSIHFMLSEEFYLGLTGRFNFLKFSGFENLVDTSLSSFNTIVFNEETERHSFADKDKFAYQLGVDLTFDQKKFGVIGQLQLSGSEEASDYFSVRPFGIHLGIYLKLNEFF